MHPKEFFGPPTRSVFGATHTLADGMLVWPECPQPRSEARPFCATGHQGGASLRHLRDTGFAVRALTRNLDQPQARTLSGPGDEVVEGDMAGSQTHSSGTELA